MMAWFYEEVMEREACISAVEVYMYCLSPLYRPSSYACSIPQKFDLQLKQVEDQTFY